jgi:hypothetical protein
LQLERLLFLETGAVDRRAKKLDRERNPFVIFGAQVIEGERSVDGVVADERPAPVPSRDQAFFFERFEALAQRSKAHP